ncbi:hypothetical protein J5Y03_00480 [Bacillus sp. RG28]|uniref:Uncharacterized protein n=1 Tax=Gottfriedia endophytica TaxID=2820819 RepID=A0A940NGP8_9BACI|nr:hypothetical protein [Gottfriedia endophytica]MBP0723657.1 hypothetical protein [Gottfriedia endophytica]
MTKKLDVEKALYIAYKTGQQVDINLRSGATLEGAIVEALWETSFRAWLEPNEPVEVGEDIDKAIVAIHAVKSVDFRTDVSSS